MPRCYLEDKKVFFNMRKLFNQLYKREPKFKRVFDSFRKVTLEVNDAENLIFFLGEMGFPISLQDYDWNIGSSFPVSINFSELFIYEEKSAYLYSGGVYTEEDKSNEGFNYYTTHVNFDYPDMDEVIVREGHSSEWKKLKGVPSVFKDIKKSLGVSSYDGATIIKVYNSETKDLVVDVVSPRYGVLDSHIYGDNRPIDSDIEEIVKTIYDLKVPVSEIFIFSLGDSSSARLRKNGTGEYTLVIE